MPLDPPSVGMLRMPVCFAHYECKYITSPTLTMMTGLVVPPPLFKSLDPPLQSLLLFKFKIFTSIYINVYIYIYIYI